MPRSLVVLVALSACGDEETPPPPGAGAVTPTPEAAVIDFREGTATLMFSGGLEGQLQLALGGPVGSELDLAEWTLDLGYAGEASLDPEVPPVTEFLVQGPVTLGEAPAGPSLAFGIVLGEGENRFEAGDEEATCITDFRRLDESGVDADLECVGLRDEAGRLFDVTGSFTAAP